MILLAKHVVGLCKIFAPFIHSPAKALHSMFSPWPFYQRGANILGPFLMAFGQLKFLIVAIDYFAKWVEAEVVSHVTTERVHRFYWQNIFCRFGLAGFIVSDNGAQFSST